MLNRPLSHRPSSALIVAVVAVILACAGTATAARLISGKQIKNGSITSTDIKNNSLLAGDFKSGQVPSGPRGPEGPRGPAGAPGASGTNGFGLLRYPETVSSFSNGESDVVGTPCPAGTYPTGGGAWAADSATGLTDHPEVITAQGLAFDQAGVGSGYFADVNDVASGNVDVVVDVVCANASQVSASIAGRGKRLH
jgi:hypothetical protein